VKQIFVSFLDDPVCDVQGSCTNDAFHSELIESADECLLLCNSFDSCEWFTFVTALSECQLRDSCPTIDETCSSCISGERGCLQEEETSTAFQTSTPPTPKGNKILQKIKSCFQNKSNQK
jgi:hypothetical protein